MNSYILFVKGSVSEPVFLFEPFAMMINQSHDRLNKFLGRINELIDTITHERNALLQRGVDPYYYIQKREELKLLQEGVEDSLKKITEAKERLEFFNEKLDEGYKELYNSWRKDARWVNAVLREREPKTKVDQAAGISRSS